jgi:hypothetical protein
MRSRDIIKPGGKNTKERKKEERKKLWSELVSDADRATAACRQS